MNSSLIPYPLSSGIHTWAPSIDVSDDTGIWVAWAEKRGKRNAICTARINDGCWTQSETVDDSVEMCNRPIVVCRSGNIHVLWIGCRGKRLTLYDSYRSRNGWHRTPLSRPGKIVGHHVVARTLSSFLVVWEEHHEGCIFLFARSFENGHWSEILNIQTGSERSQFPTAAILPDGRVAIAWHEPVKSEMRYQVRVALFNDEKCVWKLEPKKDTVSSFYPSLVADKQGNLWLTMSITAGRKTPLKTFLDREFYSQVLAPFQDMLYSRVLRFDTNGRAESFDFEEQIEYCSIGLAPSGFPILIGKKAVHNRWQVHVFGLLGNVWKTITIIDKTPEGNPADGRGNWPSLTIHNGELLIAFQYSDGRIEQEWFPIGRTGQSRISFARVMLPRYKFAEKGKKTAVSKARTSYRYHTTHHRSVKVSSKIYTLCFGELHKHSDFSWCNSSMDRSVDFIHRYMTDLIGADFTAITDHSEQISDFQWNLTRIANRLYNRAPKYVTLLAQEVHPVNIFNPELVTEGHRNLYFRSDCDKVYSMNDERTINHEGLWNALDFRTVMTLPHTTHCIPEKRDWKIYNPRFEPAIELYQFARGSGEYLGCPQSNIPREKVVPGCFVQDALALGYKFGFVSGGEHNAVGLTGVYARSLSRTAIFDAIRARRTYALTGIRKLFVDMRVDDAFIGEEKQITPNSSVQPRRIHIKIESTASVIRVDIIRNNGLVYVEKPDCQIVDFTWTDTDGFNLVAWGPPVFRTPTIYYYIRIVQEDKEMAWTSPIWLSLKVKPSSLPKYPPPEKFVKDRERIQRYKDLYWRKIGSEKAREW